MNTLPRLVLIASLLLAPGCSKSSSHTATTADGTKVTQSSKGDEVSFDVTSKSGEKTTLKASEKGMALPDDFPKDVPIPPKGIIQMFNQLGKTDTQIGVMSTTSPADLITFYETELKKQGWTIDATTKMGEGAMIVTKKGPRSIMIMIAPQDPKSTFVQLALSTKQN